MYLAKRRQSNATRMFGLIGATAVVAAVGVVLVNMRETVIRPLAPTTVFVPTQTDITPIDEPPIDLKAPDSRIDYGPVVLPPIDVFWDKTTLGTTAPPIDMGASASSGTGIAPTSTPAAPVIPRTAPKLIPGDKPEYPPASIRARESGITMLSLCVSKQGRVTSASVASSSGSDGLDRTALAWIKHERFKPGTENGDPVDVCNHSLSYEWKLPAR